ncbi:MAG TPA: ArsR family transcriptional regulator [candidate division WOR-3 bacterium]|uniref:ArsR family transcriptional regulator n=1 Tax=candidate division WOR-3 bacterium TaxID=2052148 RepID=A0A7C0Z954_UNCW3|nr:ArsR family transcriptional regulator [candidate division WOR-3 bacterium]
MEEIFRALSSNIRLKILEYIADEARTVSDIVKRFSLTQPTISHHLKVLKKVGLIVERRYKKWVYYGLNHELFDNVKGFLEKLFKKGR